MIEMWLRSPKHRITVPMNYRTTTTVHNAARLTVKHSGKGASDWRDFPTAGWRRHTKEESE